METSVLIAINDERDRINLLEEKHMSGLNITLNEIFYDSFIQNRLAYLIIL